jgi:polysaccharide pyruvyl transferase WcaK-like protein
MKDCDLSKGQVAILCSAEIQCRVLAVAGAARVRFIVGMASGFYVRNMEMDVLITPNHFFGRGGGEPASACRRFVFVCVNETRDAPAWVIHITTRNGDRPLR